MSAADRLDQIEATLPLLRNGAGYANAARAYKIATEDVPALVAALRAVLDLADRWATQSTDYDEDTEQQIDDGKAIARAIEEALS